MPAPLHPNNGHERTRPNNVYDHPSPSARARPTTTFFFYFLQGSRLLHRPPLVHADVLDTHFPTGTNADRQTDTPRRAWQLPRYENGFAIVSNARMVVTSTIPTLVPIISQGCKRVRRSVPPVLHRTYTVRNVKHGLPMFFGPDCSSCS